MSSSTDSGIIRKAAARSVDDTVAAFKAQLEQRGITLFAQVDHSGEAAKVGLTMPPTKLLIFGNPKAGTPVMRSAPSSAIDLPLKILVSQDAAGQAWISYNDPACLAARHHIPPDQTKPLSAVAMLIEGLL